jgi:hypothetical protein
MVEFRRFFEVLTVSKKGRFMATLLDTKRLFHSLQRFPARTRVKLFTRADSSVLRISVRV